MMDKLTAILNALIEKYNISNEDIAELQEALSELESGNEAEFEYKETEEQA